MKFIKFKRLKNNKSRLSVSGLGLIQRVIKPVWVLPKFRTDHGLHNASKAVYYKDVPAFVKSSLFRSSTSRIIGTRAAGAKVDKKQVKKHIQLTWNARICGAAKEKSLTLVALCSESTGKSNLARSAMMLYFQQSQNDRRFPKDNRSRVLVFQFKLHFRLRESLCIYGANKEVYC